MLCVALVPLMALAFFDHRVTQTHSETEAVLRTERLVSNTKRTVSFFLEERKQALQFIVEEFSFTELNNDNRLTSLLKSLSQAIGGYTDIGLFDQSGEHIRYIGPYDLKGRNYLQEQWFQEVVDAGSYVSDVYHGFREEPHMVIAVKKELADGSFFVLRSTVNTERFNEQLRHVKDSGFGDCFLVNSEGVIQTPSLFYGKVLGHLPFSVPDHSADVQTTMTFDQNGQAIIMGYTAIANTPFILLVIGKTEVLMNSWQNTRTTVIIFLVLCVLLIAIIIHWLATSLVNDIYRADKERLVALHEAAQTSKLASVGQLSAGIAHEINNPLAIINEKAGLLCDILEQRGKNEPLTESLLKSINAIQRAVARCANITHRLLDFARPSDNQYQAVDLSNVIEGVIEFFVKDAEHRAISITVHKDENLPLIRSDRGKLQQILLNLINNAFGAMANEGHLTVSATREEENIMITVEDDGHGIAEDDIKRIFEPFFSTKTLKGGTGLGLSITYGLVNELQGKIQVESTVGVGTKFRVTLPLQCSP